MTDLPPLLRLSESKGKPIKRLKRLRNRIRIQMFIQKIKRLFGASQ